MLCIDLYAGLGGWSAGFLAEGYICIGFDNGDCGRELLKAYPGQLVIQDILTLDGSRFKDATVIVASPPCRFFSYTSMPWSRAKALAEEVRNDPARLEKELALFRACFRIQREASEAAGRKIPLIVENVRGSQPWVGRAAWHYGSYYLWGDVPVLMPMTGKIKIGGSCGDDWFVHHNRQEWEDRAFKSSGLKLPGNNGPLRWDQREVQRLCDARKWAGMSNGGSKRALVSALIAKIPFDLARYLARMFTNDAVIGGEKNGSGN